MSPEERAREIAARYVSHSGMREQCEDEIEQAIRAAVAEEREAYQCVVDAIEGVFGLIDARKADWPDRDHTRPLARSADGARHPRGAAAMSKWRLAVAEASALTGFILVYAALSPIRDWQSCAALLLAFVAGMVAQEWWRIRP